MPVTDQAFVTLATNDVYCQGALVLGQSLRNHTTSRKLAVLITPEVSSGMRSVLHSVFDEVTEVDVLDSAGSAHLALMQRPELGITFTKLHCWTLTHYSKCVFMDADTLVLCNVDELFDREEFSAAPDSGWPDCFNSGVFVFRPSLKTYNLLLQFAAEHGSFDGERNTADLQASALRETQPFPTPFFIYYNRTPFTLNLHRSGSGGDQGLLNSFFSNWATADIGKHLPFLYNLSSSAVYTYSPAFNHFGRDAKVVHFLGETKPWNYKYNLQTKRVIQDGTISGSVHQLSFLALWWNIYSASILPLIEKLQKMEESESEEYKHTFNRVEITLKKVSPSVPPLLQVPVLPEQTNEKNPTVCSPEELAFKAQPVCEAELSGSTAHLSEPDRPSEQLVFHPALQETSELDEVARSVSELSICFKPEEPNPEDERRKWEEGRMDYMGKDAFEHIKKKLDAFLH
ncbi:glycogenin-2 isoform X2 [Calypte anna]|uniref:glycogenin-2 isoform X2 n=1 Tax=Calypte anna TaxID=9244 RepID=UPI0011C3F1D3|nr:glycogenin-2 isoform X2 [Calypte anna]